jgi:hypothetical protein
MEVTGSVAPASAPPKTVVVVVAVSKSIGAPPSVSRVSVQGFDWVQVTVRPCPAPMFVVRIAVALGDTDDTVEDTGSAGVAPKLAAVFTVPLVTEIESKSEPPVPDPVRPAN